MRIGLHALVASLFLISMAVAEETPTNKEMVCSTKEDIIKQLKERGFMPLFSMVNEEKVKQLVWVAPTDVIITAQKENEDVSCLVAKLTSPSFYKPTMETILKQIGESKE